VCEKSREFDMRRLAGNATAFLIPADIACKVSQIAVRRAASAGGTLELVRRSKFKVFISHATSDTWVARQIKSHVERIGCSTFLDAENINSGDDFEEKLIVAARQCDELLVLLTPAALERKYIWMEIGMFVGARKRVVSVLYGIDPAALRGDPLLPLTLKRLQWVDINEIDAYFHQLEGRVRTRGTT
jgi:hypothetical protein